MNNLNRLVILGVLIGLLYLLYVYQEQLVTAEKTIKVENKKINDDDSQISESKSSFGSLTLQSSDLTLGTAGSNDLNSSYDSDMSEDEKPADGLNFQVAE